MGAGGGGDVWRAVVFGQLGYNGPVKVAEMHSMAVPVVVVSRCLLTTRNHWRDGGVGSGGGDGGGGSRGVGSAFRPPGAAR